MVVPVSKTLTVVLKKSILYYKGISNNLHFCYHKYMKVAILIASDTRSNCINKEETIPLLRKLINEKGWEVADTCIVPDEVCDLKKKIIYFADTLKVDLIITSGGTGVSERDVTPEATRQVIEKEIPGLSDIMRIKSFDSVPTSILSRGISGIRGDSLIINLPGNPQGAADSLSIIIGIIPHCIEIMQGKGGHNNGRTY